MDEGAVLRMHSEQRANEPLTGEMQEGMAYPPPPSYYETMQLPAELPPLPGKASPAQSAQSRSGPGISPAVQSPSNRAAPAGGQPLYAPEFYRSPGRGYTARTPRRQAWIIAVIIGASALLLCGLGSWALATIYGAVSVQGASANQVAQDFYQHVLQQDYHGAFADLSINGLTASAFQQDAQSVDARYGLVASFSIDTTSFNSASSAAHEQITVHVTRQQATYSVQVSLESIGGNWKIMDIDLSKF